MPSADDLHRRSQAAYNAAQRETDPEKRREADLRAHGAEQDYIEAAEDERYS